MCFDLSLFFVCFFFVKVKYLRKYSSLRALHLLIVPPTQRMVQIELVYNDCWNLRTSELEKHATLFSQLFLVSFRTFEKCKNHKGRSL